MGSEDPPLSRYSRVRCRVISREEDEDVVFLRVDLPGGGVDAAIEYDYLAGGEYPPRHALPVVGDELDAIVGGRNSRGRVFLTTAPSMLRLVAEASDVQQAMAAYDELVRAGATPEAIRRFRAAPDRAAVLRWGLNEWNVPGWPLHVLRESPLSEVREFVPELIALQGMTPWRDAASSLLSAVEAEYGPA